MSNKLVSVILTTYKRSDKIVKRAIDSVLNQTYSDWELFVVDDSPCDYAGRKAIAKLVNSYRDKRIKYIPLEKNMGACFARNKGIELSSGEFTCFLDDDDAWVDTKLAKQIDKFSMSDSETALIYCGAKFYDEEKKQTIEHKNLHKRGYVFDELITKNFIGGSSFPMIKSSVLKELGGFDIELLSAQDLDMWLRIAEKYKIDCVEEPLVIYYRHHGEQISKTPKKRIQGMERKIEKNKSYLEKHPRQYSSCMFDLACANAMGGNLHEAFLLRKKANNIYEVGIIERFSQILRLFKHHLKYRHER